MCVQMKREKEGMKWNNVVSITTQCDDLEVNVCMALVRELWRKEEG